MEDARGMAYCHRLHYRWSQLEADKCGINVGSPLRPLTRADRVLHLDEHREYSCWPLAPSETQWELARFSGCADVYQSIDYNTFCKNGCLKLTEVELFFLSSRMTRSSAHGWAVVYLGIGNGERFRYLRDEFFPDLAVVAFDPLDDFFTGCKDEVRENARLWSEDGTNFTFHVRCFDFDSDAAWIRERYRDRRLLLISDIRGIALLDDGKTFDKAHDQDLQWRTIQCLRPDRSLVKFAVPDPRMQFYDYAPGVILKQIFCYYGTREVRLMIDGVPQQTKRYNAWELYEKMMYHHEHMRGQVYETTRRPDWTSCLCFCFDCSVLWDTLAAYAAQNHVDPHGLLTNIIKYHIYTPGQDSDNGGWESFMWVGPSRTQRWWDVEWYLNKGKLMEAVAALEAPGEEDVPGTDWADIAHGIAENQPSMAERLRCSLRRPACRSDLTRLLGSLAEPFTLVGTDLNGLLDWRSMVDN
mmetsp:Transcript_120645/g.336647  ORF Transcript_120645/g.336647 Transcript_120645/m.336647 type:complete len:469 (+) Transcript_120645:79-1485(+)